MCAAGEMTRNRDSKLHFEAYRNRTHAHIYYDDDHMITVIYYKHDAHLYTHPLGTHRYEYFVIFVDFIIRKCCVIQIVLGFTCKHRTTHICIARRIKLFVQSIHIISVKGTIMRYVQTDDNNDKGSLIVYLNFW